MAGGVDRQVAGSYEEHRRRLIAAGFPVAILVVFSLTLFYELADLFKDPAIFWAEALPNTLQLSSLLVALALVRGPLQSRAEIVALGIDLFYTAVLTGRLMLPETTGSGTALFLSLKMLATAVLFPWAAQLQYVSVFISLGFYFAMIGFSGRSVEAMHQLLGPMIAAVVSAVGAARGERTRHALYLRGTMLAESEARLRSLLENEQVLVKIAREISELTDLRTLLNRVNRRTAEALRCDFSTTLLLDESRRELAAASTFTTIEDDRQDTLGYRSPTDTPVAQELLAGRMVVIDESTQQPWIDPALLQRFKIRHLALAPITVKGQPLGVLTAGRINTQAPFDERDVALLNGLAAHTAVAIENAQLFDSLRSSEARYRELFERANDLIFVVDETGTFRSANQAALDFVQVQADELPRLTWQELLPADTVRELARRLQVANRRQLEAGPPFEVEVQRPDGSRAALEVRTRVISPPGQPRIIHCIGRDVTDRHRQALETQRLLNRLRESSRLQGEFVANMSHELRTPLNVIIGYTDLLIDDSSLSQERDARVFLERIGSAARALHRLVESVLEYARIDRGRTILIPTRFSADQLLLELRGLSNDVRSSPDVNLQIEPAPGIELATDYDRLYSVMSNLMLNAIKFTPRGEVHLSARRVEDQVEFCVRDTGIGIAPEELAHVFEPFRQVDGSPTRSFGGVGLGLAIVRRNVDLLGGCVEVDSAVDSGSTFRVRIPLELDLEPAPESSAPAQAVGA